jgi:hypothetical protein
VTANFSTACTPETCQFQSISNIGTISASVGSAGIGTTFGPGPLTTSQQMMLLNFIYSETIHSPTYPSGFTLSQYSNSGATLILFAILPEGTYNPQFTSETGSAAYQDILVSVNLIS